MMKDNFVNRAMVRHAIRAAIKDPDKNIPKILALVERADVIFHRDCDLLCVDVESLRLDLCVVTDVGFDLGLGNDRDYRRADTYR